MRLQKSEIAQIRETIIKEFGECQIYIFGSQLNESKRGGDIDILILAERELKRKEKASIEFDFFKKFGEQKLDLVSYRYDAKDSFKEVILEEAVAL